MWKDIKDKDRYKKCVQRYEDKELLREFDFILFAKIGR